MKKIIDGIRAWFFLNRIKRVKRQLAWEVKCDKLFMERNYKDLLEYNDGPDREFLMAERQKEEAKQDKVRIVELEEKITQSKSVKQTYRKTIMYLEELNQFKRILRNINWPDLI